jgi:outer membrane protein assembly factor BamB
MHAPSPRTCFLAGLAAAAVLSVAAVVWLMAGDPARDIRASVPGQDDPLGRKAQLRQDERVAIGSIFQAFDVPAGQRPGAWPGFRGPNRDNIVTGGPALSLDWPAAGPRVVWSVELGEGHAAPAVRDGRVYVLDYDEAAEADLLRCFSLDDGRELWRRGYRVHVKRNHGRSRTVPAVSGDRVVTIGPRCHVMAVDATTGALAWGFGLVERYGAVVPGWYTGQCPLTDGDEVVLAPAGTNTLLVGVALATGEERWCTPNSGAWPMSHSSIMIATLAGKRMYLYCAVGAVVGVSAEAADRGRLLWSLPWSPSVVAPSPVAMANDLVFCTAGYGGGALVLRVRREGDAFRAETVRRYAPTEGLACEQQTPVYHNGRLYGILPRDAGPARNQFACADEQGAVRWGSGKTLRFGLAPFLLADGKFWILDDDGGLTVADASGDRFEVLAQAKVLPGPDAWGPLALAGTRLLLRDLRRLVCVELGEGGKGGS